MIILGFLLGVSCLVNVCLIYYVCCKRKRKKKRHLTAVQQSTLSRRTGSQAGLDNLGIQSDICTEPSTNIRQNNLLIQKNGIKPADPSEDENSKQLSREAAADQWEMEQHVYQRLQSCVLDPMSEEYIEILEHGPQKSPNQHAERKEIVKSVRAASYQSLKPKGLERSKDDGNGKVNRYEHLQLRDRLPEEVQPSLVEQGPSTNENANEDIPDYVDIVDDSRLVTNAKAPPTSSGTTISNLYETLKPAQGSPSHQVDAAGPCSTPAADQNSVQVASQEEDNYMELLAWERGYKIMNYLIEIRLWRMWLIALTEQENGPFIPHIILKLYWIGAWPGFFKGGRGSHCAKQKVNTRLSCRPLRRVLPNVTKKRLTKGESRVPRDPLLISYALVERSFGLLIITRHKHCFTLLCLFSWKVIYSRTSICWFLTQE